MCARAGQSPVSETSSTPLAIGRGVSGVMTQIQVPYPWPATECRPLVGMFCNLTIVQNQLHDLLVVAIESLRETLSAALLMEFLHWWFFIKSRQGERNSPNSTRTLFHEPLKGANGSASTWMTIVLPQRSTLMTIVLPQGSTDWEIARRAVFAMQWHP